MRAYEAPVAAAAPAAVQVKIHHQGDYCNDRCRSPAVAVAAAGVEVGVVLTSSLAVREVGAKTGTPDAQRAPQQQVAVCR